jgi:hypothetical protein
MDERRLRLADYDLSHASVPAPEKGVDPSLPRSAARVLDAIEAMSRRIDDLARELDCIGRIQPDDDDRPQAD